MNSHRTLPILLVLALIHCSSNGGAAPDPASPTPVADPRSAQGGSGSAKPRGTEGTEKSVVPLRPDQAPIVEVREALQADSLLGRRVRVSGRCIARGEGLRAGSWTLDQAGVSIEVRGLVPPSCALEEKADLTIFAQVEPKTTGSQEHILLRLPD
jgi:hypothetical protein